MSKQLVIIGGGFAGATFAQTVETILPSDWTILLLSKENYITYNPLLPETVGASILPSHVVAPLRQMMRRTQVCMVNVTDIDIQQREVHYLGEGSGITPFDQLVLACGAVANLRLIPGMDKYTLPLKTLGDALFMRNRIMSRLEHADMQSDRAMRQWLLTFVVIGGGFSGVEVAGAIADLLREAVRYYPHLSYQECKVILIHNGERILPELSPQLSYYAQQKMKRNGIEIWLQTEASRIDDRGVWLKTGDSITGGTVISTIGSAPNPLLEHSPLAKQRGRIITNLDMSVPNTTGIWAIGDCALIINSFDNHPCPPTAQLASRQAKQLAKNLLQTINGQETLPFYYKPQGQLSSIGHNRAVAEVFGFKFYGFIGWLLWRAVYLLKLPTLARKCRIFMEWNWQMLFPPDIVHLRFTRTTRNGSNLHSSQVNKKLEAA